MFNEKSLIESNSWTAYCIRLVFVTITINFASDFEKASFKLDIEDDFFGAIEERIGLLFEKIQQLNLSNLTKSMKDRMKTSHDPPHLSNIKDLSLLKRQGNEFHKTFLDIFFSLAYEANIKTLKDDCFHCSSISSYDGIFNLISKIRRVLMHFIIDLDRPKFSIEIQKRSTIVSTLIATNSEEKETQVQQVQQSQQPSQSQQPQQQPQQPYYEDDQCAHIVRQEKAFEMPCDSSGSRSMEFASIQPANNNFDDSRNSVNLSDNERDDDDDNSLQKNVKSWQCKRKEFSSPLIQSPVKKLKLDETVIVAITLEDIRERLDFVKIDRESIASSSSSLKNAKTSERFLLNQSVRNSPKKLSKVISKGKVKEENSQDCIVISSDLEVKEQDYFKREDNFLKVEKVERQDNLLKVEKIKQEKSIERKKSSKLKVIEKYNKDIVQSLQPSSSSSKQQSNKKPLKQSNINSMVKQTSKAPILNEFSFESVLKLPKNLKKSSDYEAIEDEIRIIWKTPKGFREINTTINIKSKEFGYFRIFNISKESFIIKLKLDFLKKVFGLQNLPIIGSNLKGQYKICKDEKILIRATIDDLWFDVRQGLLNQEIIEIIMKEIFQKYQNELKQFPI